MRRDESDNLKIEIGQALILCEQVGRTLSPSCASRGGVDPLFHDLTAL